MINFSKIAKDMAQEDSYIVMLGGLHMKMTLLKSVGDLLNSSGWVQITIQADIAMLGTAVISLGSAYKENSLWCRYTDYAHDAGKLLFDDCSTTQRALSPQFKFWEQMLKIDMTIMVWDQAVYQGSIPLYVAALSELQWLFFAVNHHNYAWSVAVHLRDMVTLSEWHTDVLYIQFCKGHFTVNKSRRLF